MNLKTEIQQHKAFPIRSVKISGKEHFLLLKESNLNIAPITSKNDKGVEVTVAYKLTATLYTTSDDALMEFEARASSNEYAPIIWVIYCGDTNSFSSEGTGRIAMKAGKGRASSVTFSIESAESMIKTKIVITGIYRKIDVYDFLFIMEYPHADK